MMMADQINYFDLVKDVEPDPNGAFAAAGSLERGKIVAEIAKMMKESASYDRLGEIYDRSKDPELRQMIKELSPERRAKLNFLINTGVVFDEFQ